MQCVVSCSVCALVVVCSLVVVDRGWLHVPCCLVVVYTLLSGVRDLLFAVSCALRVVCCMQVVVCCVVYVVWCVR